MNYEKLLQPGKIGSLELKNRFVMGAMGVGFAKLNGHPTRGSVQDNNSGSVRPCTGDS